MHLSTVLLNVPSKQEKKDIMQHLQQEFICSWFNERPLLIGKIKAVVRQQFNKNMRETLFECMLLLPQGKTTDANLPRCFDILDRESSKRTFFKTIKPFLKDEAKKEGVQFWIHVKNIGGIPQVVLSHYSVCVIIHRESFKISEAGYDVRVYVNYKKRRFFSSSVKLLQE